MELKWFATAVATRSSSSLLILAVLTVFCILYVVSLYPLLVLYIVWLWGVACRRDRCV